ncbi:MAG: prolipoprotein diacylglyceryl transferase [Clostridia bacterium]|nr:prolipoprotein diacylglyceryl transferase [Clostridia bacterium]
MRAIELGPVRLYPYGLVLALSAAAAFALMHFLGKKHGLKHGTVSWFAVLSIPLALLFAHLSYSLVRLDWLLDQGLAFFWQFTRGGYMLYGAMLGGILAGCLTAKITRQSMGGILDAAAAPTALMIAVCRMAEPLVGLGYGYDIEEWFDPFEEKCMVAWEDPSALFRFPLGEQNYYGIWCFSVYLPEAVTAFIIFLILLCMKKRKPGGKALLLALLYAGCQPFWESMRQDAVLKWGFVRASQLFSGIAVLTVLIICWRMLPPSQRRPAALWKGIGLLLLGCGIIMAMEFALEKKIGFLTWMRMDVCYGVMILGCLSLILAVLPVWKKAFPKIDA